MMLGAGLFKKFPRLDYCSARAHGTVAYSEGLALANVDSVDITVRGKGGHGAAPHRTVDPIVLAARVVLDLQTLVSRENNPLDPAVVTVGPIHGGTKHNIIPDEVKLQITVRSTKDSVRKHLLDGIKRVAEAAAKGANAPPPVVRIDPEEFTPALYNEPSLTRKTVAVFKEGIPTRVFRPTRKRKPLRRPSDEGMPMRATTGGRFAGTGSRRHGSSLASES
jgi:hippurate hydrolase